MKRNNILYLAIAAFGLSSLTSCQKENEDSASSGEEVSLSFRSSVKDMNEENLTRAVGNNFFIAKDQISVDITTNRSSNNTSTHTYSYNEKGEFTGDFRFKLDNTYITKLVAKWPGEDVRTKDGIVLDQRKEEDFQQADRLKAHITDINIMPTVEPIPLTFTHEQSRFSFRMAGQNANGLNIQSIILELQYDENYGKEPTTPPNMIPGAFWAHCPGGETAELILVPGIKVAGKSNGGNFIIVDGRYMIGQATVGNETTQYTGGIWLKEDVNITLEAGKDYLVTLTPEGYNLIATITIGGFGQDEGFVGIPIQMPTVVQSGTTYEIKNAIQLVTLSRLLKGGYIANQEASIWQGYDYVIKSSTIMTDNASLYYLPIAATLKDKFKDENGIAITEVKDVQGESFNLFAN